jgi:hypothetical protein
MTRRDLLSRRELERRATESGDQPFWALVKWRFILSAVSLGVLVFMYVAAFVLKLFEPVFDNRIAPIFDSDRALVAGLLLIGGLGLLWWRRRR